MWVIDEFTGTDYLSTSSIALAVVADFKSEESTVEMIGLTDSDVLQIKIRICTEEDIALEQSLKVASQSLKFYSDFFKTSIKLEKFDVIVVGGEYFEVHDYYGLIYLTWVAECNTHLVGFQGRI